MSSNYLGVDEKDVHVVEDDSPYRQKSMSNSSKKCLEAWTYLYFPTEPDVMSICNHKFNNDVGVWVGSEPEAEKYFLL